MSLARAGKGSGLADSSVDRAAIKAFSDRYGHQELGPVCVILPAFQEERSIGRVLDSVPDEVCGIQTHKLVVIDGCTDRSAEVAAEHGAFVCESPVNRGQGAALRLGYRLALEHETQYVVTVDADGQWDSAEMERLVKPLVDRTADFVQGSRRLGWAANEDKVRAAGVLVFAALINALTGAKVTDSSSGFRAMRTDVLADLALEQDQYQASELLIAVLARGFRVVERPVTMKARTAGRSKKGSNLAYGAHYAGVIFKTWLRERNRVRR
ncbi:MAG: glycosyltransferase family 2 protein [Actinomycetota bacterium]|nr:glycosyltransferase family 2 protein [Actinomycetota bacterium]